ncbi:ATP-binding cassette domain-containing protein [Sanguibacter sp. 25GB23B1]|uniref:ABC transporter ATP-binding protein n=1 Tax=unclassified Sanguibacter TaxID=2645534 RepID=UPI0032AEFE75
MTGTAAPPDVDPATLAVSTRGLRKTYRTRHGRQVAVQGLDLDVPIGGVHGFLGPNGSGKTTSIRMLLGLIRADSGTMSIFGHEVPEQLPTVIDRIGAIVEQPKFFPNFSARKNLDLLAGGIGAPSTAVGKVLDDVGLSDRAKDRYRTYSLGMKQRLAIAATLLKDPDLLIFDEPTNGLDPAGIREIRTTMRGLAERGKTVLVSSHILAEVEQVADTVSIIGHGRLLASGSVAEIIGGGAHAATTVRVGVADLATATRVLTEAGLSVRADGEILVVDGAADPADITRRLAHHELYVNELVPVRAGLESVFLSLTAGEGPGTHLPLGESPGSPKQGSPKHGGPEAGAL